MGQGRKGPFEGYGRTVQNVGRGSHSGPFRLDVPESTHVVSRTLRVDTQEGLGRGVQVRVRVSIGDARAPKSVCTRLYCGSCGRNGGSCLLSDGVGPSGRPGRDWSQVRD